MDIFDRDFWEIIILIWSVISFFGALILYVCKAYSKVKSYREKPVSNYNNDNFARETIKFRFNDIISKINNAVSCEKPFLLYKDFQDTIVGNCKFHDHIALQTSASNANADLMRIWMKKFDHLAGRQISNFLTKAPFIDSEYLFYFYVLTRTYDYLDTDEKKQVLHSGYSSEKNMQFDPYKSNKLRMLDNDFLNDKEENPDSGHKSKIKESLKLIQMLDEKINDCDWRKILFEMNEPLNILQSNLSSNSSDLSQMFWSKFDNVHLLADDCKKFWDDYCKDVGKKTVNIIVDNFGIEFLSDLVLGYYLKEKGASKIVYHVKHIPMFVSDVVVDDHIVMLDRIETLVKGSKNAALYLGALSNLKSMVKNGAFEFKANYLWNMPFSFSEIVTSSVKTDKSETHKLIKEVISIFTGDDLLIVKGDLNYRRLVEDKLWNPQRKTLSRIRYIKCPILVIRSYKSSVVMDCSRSDIIAMHEKFGSDWKTEGRVGAVLYYKAQPKLFKRKR